MSKGHKRRPIEISVEEADLQWDLTFAETDEAKHQAKKALEKYYEKRKKGYIEKRSMGM